MQVDMVSALKQGASDQPHILTLDVKRNMNMARNFEIAQRAADQKFVTWAEVDDPDVDRDWYLKNGLPVPQRWVAVQVSHTRDAAIRATRQFRQ
jgi:hypothetical protein